MLLPLQIRSIRNSLSTFWAEQTSSAVVNDLAYLLFLKIADAYSKP